MQNIIVLLVSVLLGAVGQVLFKVGMNKVGKIELSQLISNLLTIITTPQILIGFICFGLSSLIWMVVISKIQLSTAYPMVSLGYVFVFILSIILFNESITLYKGLGLSVIILGVILMGRG